LIIIVDPFLGLEAKVE
jgi:hypothetical protein